MNTLENKSKFSVKSRRIPIKSIYLSKTNDEIYKKIYKFFIPKNTSKKNYGYIINNALDILEDYLHEYNIKKGGVIGFPNFHYITENFHIIGVIIPLYIVFVCIANIVFPNERRQIPDNIQRQIPHTMQQIILPTICTEIFYLNRNQLDIHDPISFDDFENNQKLICVKYENRTFYYLYDSFEKYINESNANYFLPINPSSGESLLTATITCGKLQLSEITGGKRKSRKYKKTLKQNISKKN